MHRWKAISYRMARCGLVAGAFLSANSFAASPLADAAMNKDLLALRSQLRIKADVNAPQADGTTALHWAVRLDDLEMADALLQRGAHVNSVTRLGSTPLELACINGSARMIERLLQAGANANSALSPRGETPLMMAARTGNPDAVKVLLDHGAAVDTKESNRGQTALLWAAAEGHAAVVRLLLEHGAQVNARSNVVVKGRGPKGAGGPAEVVDPNVLASDACPPAHPAPRPEPEFGVEGRTVRTKAVGGGCMSALILAVRRNDMEIARTLVAAGADVNLTMGDGTSPLNVAIINAHFAMASWLLDQGADPNIADGKGMAALYAAVDMRNVRTTDVPSAKPDALDPLELIQQILDRKANVNARLTAKLPYRGGTDPTWQSEVGATPFLRAAYSNDVVAMRLLLAHGADPSITASDKTTPLMAAAGVGWLPSLVYTRNENLIESLRLCLELGNDINASNDGKPNSGGPSGLTALHGAAFKGLPEAVQFLVDHGANIFAKDTGEGDVGERGKGRTPFDWAEGVYFEGQPPRLQEKTAQLLRSLMNKESAARH